LQHKAIYNSWAIKTIEKHPSYHKLFYKQILKLVKTDELSLSKQALDYFKPKLLENVTIQQQLVKLIVEVDMNLSMRFSGN